jgi:hypothetical protein
MTTYTNASELAFLLWALENKPARCHGYDCTICRVSGVYNTATCEAKASEILVEANNQEG